MESHLLCGLPHYFQVLNPNAARGRVVCPLSWLISMLRMLFSLHPLHVVLIAHLNFSNPLFSFECVIIPPLFFSSLFTCIIFHLPSMCCPPSPPLSSASFTQQHLVLCRSVSIPQCWSESKNHLRLLRSVHPTGTTSDKPHTENSLLLYHCVWTDEIVIDKTILHWFNEAC